MSKKDKILKFSKLKATWLVFTISIIFDDKKIFYIVDFTIIAIVIIKNLQSSNINTKNKNKNKRKKNNWERVIITILSITTRVNYMINPYKTKTTHQFLKPVLILKELIK